MDIVYRVLGFVAMITEKLSRTRVNFIPINWLLIVLVTIFLGLSIREVHEGLANADSASLVSLADALTNPDLLDKYVTIDAALVLQDTLLYAKKNSDKVEDAESLWTPLLDPAAKHAMYAKLPPTQAPAGSFSRNGVTGMLRSIDSNLKTEVQRTGRQTAGVLINTDRMLVIGQKPSRLGITIPIAIALALALTLMLLSVFIRYTVFRSMPQPRAVISRAATDQPPQPDQLDGLRLTGFLSLTETDRQRFFNVPATLANLDSGERALLSNINASITYMGAVTKNRAGLWASIIKPASLAAPEYGQLYFGLRAYPALRIRYTDPIANRPLCTILALPTESARESLRHSLYAPPAQPR
ncbi:MAG: hypothetical protein NTU53_01610 [Planctomycetota bacterium]|nr:hypothetical protein [Planctomycetota bacterium]